MLKMLLDAMGGIVITNDGNCILREVDVSHPAAKSMIELSRAQDEEVGDGTTSVIVLSKLLAIRGCLSVIFPHIVCRWRNSVHGPAIVGKKLPPDCHSQRIYQGVAEGVGCVCQDLANYRH